MARSSTNRITSFVAPASVARSASRALRWRRTKQAGTRVGWTRANQLAKRRPVSLKTIKRMKAYFDRHAVDSLAIGWLKDEPGFPSKGRRAQVGRKDFRNQWKITKQPIIKSE